MQHICLLCQLFLVCIREKEGFPWWLSDKEAACKARDTGDPGSTPGSGRREEALEEEMVTHSSILPRNVPWTEEAGRLQSMGLPRVGHD